MEYNFTFEEQEIRKTVRKFVTKDLLPVSRAVEETGEIPPAVKAGFLSMGLLKSVFPRSWGGVDGTFTGLVIALKELSYGSWVPAWILFENFMLAYPVNRFGSGFLKTRYLPDLINLEATGALAFTEADTGSDPVQIKTSATKSENGWIINGAKRFITHSGSCDQMILFALTGERITAFLIEGKNRGFRAGKRESFLHMQALDNGDLYLEDYFAPDDHVIGKVGQGFEILLETEAVGKIAFVSLYVGLAERALDLAVQYARTREHRGTPIGHKFQMTQYRLAEMKARVEAMKAYLFHACAKVDRHENVLEESAALKLLVATDIKKVVADAMEIHGAYGLSDEYEIGRIYKAAVSAQAVMGSLDIQRVIIAKGLLRREIGR